MVDPKKKIQIKPFRARVQMDRHGAEKLWLNLASAMNEIHNRNSSSLSFEELYRAAYNLVIQKHGTLLYKGVTDKLSEQLLATAERLSSAPDSTLLEEVSASFQEHVTTMAMVRDILMYMDRTYVTQQKSRPVFELGLHLYRIIVWEHENVMNRVTELLLQAIANERAGLLTDDRTLLKANLTMLQQLGMADHSNVYERDFDGVFLGTTQEFYQNESSAYLAENSASDYVNKAVSRLGEEKARSEALALPPTTEVPLFQMLETELIERHAKTLVIIENSGFAVLLKDDTKINVMKDMYDLFARVPSSVEFLREALCERVMADGKALVADQDRGASDPSTFIRGVLKMDERYKNVVEVAFRGEAKSKKRLKESFENFLNSDTRAASYLAVYADDLLRSGLKGATEEEVTKLLNNVILVFRYISDKDVFESFYKQHLAKRLLSGRSVSDDAEKSMVSLLKAECGYQFTSKLEGMFNDMRISRDTRDAYKLHKRNSVQAAASKKNVDLDVDVLTTGYWPSQKVPMCTLPEPVDIAIKHFSGFYLDKHTGRKLQWQTSTGSAEIRAVFGKGPNFRRHDLCVSTYQMCILMLFNDNDTLTLREIARDTNIPSMELKRHLISLCTPKHRVLRKGSKGKGISGENDKFTFNVDYTSKLKRVKIPLVSMKDASRSGKKGDGSKAGMESNPNEAVAEGKLPALVEEERRHLVEAATVRIMKARKTLKHNDLIAEVTKQLSSRFVPSPQFIKKRIAGLIERDYLERDENDHRLYSYVA
uniref:Cullin family profile domain-containing protein n=1 Tax=Chaetoceros debilis TaxID=122233 RepID=A0A7S3PYP2_9STRA|mmetsp:Transcript_3062/g.4515  ORF Transcript_3062/g.4515 Transcript_3062/m.4515 type:complete len:768 (+) Transcript_3062:223-2526(+)|eukprot:CAMPEP_0194097174 /NCGR_PEP_ID=MMETSP0149-20130528/57729_1 /TAXON_ID=122233 /ORGANISM="Chaetoceros debilis, Strain MM31A-1" /LENGTH=767 /DNA_ID=CAMNT_0038783187 /DNA_START=91 /DNA_END=2394 /DNA_ORIENTATION=-